MAGKTRTLTVAIVGDSSGVKHAFGQVDKSAAQSESKVAKFGKASALAFAGLGVAAGGAAFVGLKKSVEAAQEAEKSNAKLQAQLKASGISYQAHAKEIDNVIQKTSRLAGLDDEDLQDAFTNVVRATGSVNTAMKDMGLVADLARGKHMDVAKAGELVAKVHAGNVGPLKRLGIEFEKSTANVDKLKETNKKYTPEQLKAAQAADKQANSEKALGLLRDRLKGQAEAYGKTTAGATDRAKVAMENLGEVVGAKVAPLVAKGATALVDLIDKSGQLAGPIRTSTGAIRNAYDRVSEAVSNFVTKNRGSINEVIGAAKRLGSATRTAFEAIAPVVARVAGIVGRHLGRIAEVLGDVVGVIVALVNGDWKKAWHRAGTVVSDAFDDIVQTAKDVGGLLWDAMTGLGKLIVRGILKGMGNLGHAILGKVKDAAGFVGDQIGKLNPFGDGVGKVLGDGVGKAVSGLTPAPIPGGGLPSLMGAQAALAPVASAAAGFGLRTSSGRRPGSITSSGNVSYHSTGEALDEAGSPSNMMRFFRYMKSKFGPRLAELIYTPGGVGIKDGQPHRYTGAVAADHYDHVHVAIDTGAPGVGDGLGRHVTGPYGDGLGKFVATSYGPPWEGIQGTGTTATGVNLKDSPHTYGIAVDPSKLSLGKSYYVWPNPFGYKGPFKAFDTGGAIKGNRIDFYDWRGRKQQNAWGTRTVEISTTADGVKGKKAKGPYKGPRVAVTIPGGATSSAGAAAPSSDAPSSFELNSAFADVGVAQAATTATTNDDQIALANQKSVVDKRIKTIKKALKKRGLKPSTRLRLTQELSGLIGTSQGIGTQLGDLGKLDPATGQAIPDPPPAPSWDDYLGAEASSARLTAGLGDDMTSASRMLDTRRAELTNALAGGDPRAIRDAADALKAASDNFDSVVEQMKQEKVDWANADLALAQLTDTLDDDKAALEKKKELDEQALAEAKAANDPRKIAEAAGNLKADTEALKSLTDSIDQSNQLAQERMNLDKQIADNQLKLLAMAGQGPEILAAIVAAVSGSIGGKSGLGFQSVGVPGRVATY